MSSAAGINRYPTYGGAVLLDNLTPSVPAAGTSTAFGPAYGTIGANDSGGLMFAAAGFSKWRFQMVPLTSTVPTGFAVSIYGTISYTAYTTWENTMGPNPSAPAAWLAAQQQAGQAWSTQNFKNWQPVSLPGISNAAGFVPGIQPWEWVLIEAPSENTGTGMVTNPMTPSAPLLVTTAHWMAVRAVLTTAGTAGAVRIVAQAIP